MRRLISLNKKTIKSGLTEKNDNLHIDKLNKYINDIEEDMLNGDIDTVLEMNRKIVHPNDLEQFSVANQRLKRIKDLVADIDLLNKQQSKNGDVFFRVYRDDVNDLVAVLFDLGAFTPDDLSTPTLYLSFGYCGSQRSKMYLHYAGDGSLEICDLFSQRERRGHGGLMLKALLEIVPEMNNKIAEYNERFYSETKHRYSYEKFINSISYKKEINHIRGKMVPGRNLTIEDLRRFYGRYGFIKDGRLHREV